MVSLVRAVASQNNELLVKRSVSVDEPTSTFAKLRSLFDAFAGVL